MKEIILILIIVICTMLSTILITNKYNEVNKISDSVNELRYYINEDVFNGNLDKDVYEFYAKELYNIEQSINKLKE